MHAEPLRTLAIEALVHEWLGYWTWIVLAGALPALTRRLVRWPRTPVGAARWRRYASFLALLGCLNAWRALADTWRVEAREPDALAFAACEAASVRSWGPVGELRCTDARAYALRFASASAPAPPALVCLAYLPTTRIVLAWRVLRLAPDCGPRAFAGAEASR